MRKLKWLTRMFKILVIFVQAAVTTAACTRIREYSQIKIGHLCELCKSVEFGVGGIGYAVTWRLVTTVLLSPTIGGITIGGITHIREFAKLCPHHG